MNDAANKVIRGLANAHDLNQFGAHLLARLQEDINDGQVLTTSRARAIFAATGTLDDAAWHDFQQRLASDANQRILLAELMADCKLMELVGRGAMSEPDGEVSGFWLPLVLAAYAYKSEYQLNNLDPSSPPAVHTPAGLLIAQAAHCVRRQGQRTATERDRLMRKLAFDGSQAPALSELPGGRETIAPVPPHFRSPVPVRYPEYNPDVTVEANEVESGGPVVTETPQSSPIDVSPPVSALPTDVTRGEAITITEGDIEPPQPPPTRMPPITITADQLAPPPPPRQTRPVSVPQPPPSSSSSTGFTNALRGLLGSEELKSTKLRITVHDYPDGAAMYGLQVSVSCRGIRSHVAGTTDRQGRFVCQLPVRIQSGLTYDVDVTWPRDLGGETERKSITLNADRTEFTLPFYRRLQS